MKIYFVCTGNTCRSPMAEALFQAKNMEHIEVRSAGIYAMNDGEISENAKQVIADHGIQYTHFSRAVSEDDLRWANLVLTMTSAHKQLLVSTYPFAADKTFTLKEYTRPYGSHDVSDPFGGNIQTYQKTFDELKVITDELELRLLKENQ